MTLIERLRGWLVADYIEAYTTGSTLIREAADEIERLTAERDALRADAERLDCGQIMIDTFDEFGEPKQVWHTGMDLRAAIDAAIIAQAQHVT